MSKINILEGYKFKIFDYNIFEIEKILNNNHDYVILKKICREHFVLLNIPNNKYEVMPCIVNVYTTDKNGAAIKIPKSHNKCFKGPKLFETYSEIGCIGDCKECHIAALNKFKRKSLFLVKNRKKNTNKE